MGFSVGKGELTAQLKRIVFGLSIIFTLCTLCTIGGVTASLVILNRKGAPHTPVPIMLKSHLASFLASIKYNPLAQACILTKTGPSVIVSFAALVGSLRTLLSVTFVLKATIRRPLNFQSSFSPHTTPFRVHGTPKVP